MQVTVLFATLFAALASTSPIAFDTNYMTAATQCSYNNAEPFGITTVPFGSPSAAQPLSSCNSASSLRMTLANGRLTDAMGRTGYIADNRQFQFDKPAQAGAIIQNGFGLCPVGNGGPQKAVGINGNKEWYRCRSGTFYNLYDRSIGAQCEKVELRVVKLVNC